MQMNKLKYHQLIPLLLLVVISISVLAAGAGNQEPESTQAATPSDEPKEPSTGEDDTTPDTQQDAEAPPPASAPASKPIKPFNPTEKIQADSAVTFPIDI